MAVFSVEEPDGKKTYIWDKDEDYIIVLEPLRNKEEEDKTAQPIVNQLVICTPDVQPSAIKQRAFLLIIKCL